jgi:hypothetical protein
VRTSGVLPPTFGAKGTTRGVDDLGAARYMNSVPAVELINELIPWTVTMRDGVVLKLWADGYSESDDEYAFSVLRMSLWPSRKVSTSADPRLATLNA